MSQFTYNNKYCIQKCSKKHYNKKTKGLRDKEEKMFIMLKVKSREKKELIKYRFVGIVERK